MTSGTAGVVNTEHSVLEGEQEKNWSEGKSSPVRRSSYLFLSVVLGTALGHPSQRSCHNTGAAGRASGSLLFLFQTSGASFLSWQQVLSASRAWKPLLGLTHTTLPCPLQQPVRSTDKQKGGHTVFCVWLPHPLEITLKIFAAVKPERCLK